MKNLILIIFSAFSCIAVLAQKGPNELFTVYNVAPAQTERIIHVDSDTSDHSRRPAIFVILGSGQVFTASGGSDTSRLWDWGPLKLLNAGWDGVITVGGKTFKPHWFIMQPYGASETPVYNMRKIDSIKVRYPTQLDTTRFYATGLSLGANVFTRAVCEGYAHVFTAIVPMSVAITDPTKRDSALIQPYATAGGYYYGMVGVNDNNNEAKTRTPAFVNAMNLYRSGSGQYYGWTHDAGAHTGWDTEYSTSTRRNGYNVYEWMMLYSDRPYAKAPGDIITTDTSITLNGVLNEVTGGHSGQNRTVTWSKLSGGAANITSASSDTTTVTGLEPGEYTFQLTSANATGGLTASDTVTVTIESEIMPYLKSVPRITRPTLSN